MNPVLIAKYMLVSSLIVIPLILGVVLLFMTDDRREELRERIKRRLYISRKSFKVLMLLAGVCLVATGLIASVSVFVQSLGK